MGSGTEIHIPNLCFVEMSVNYKWIDNLGFYLFFNSISVISGRWEGDNKKQCAIEYLLQIKRSLLHTGLEPGSDGA